MKYNVTYLKSLFTVCFCEQTILVCVCQEVGTVILKDAILKTMVHLISGI